MKNKKIITYVILQELRFMQHIGGLRKAGYETDNMNVEMLHIIPPLMGVPMKTNGEFPDVSDELDRLYDVFSDLAINYSDQLSPMALKQLAKACYLAINVLVQAENQPQNPGKSGHGSH